ncbi:hypothetical protein [Nocardioides marmoriginsengisoli]|uniref:hypothetical protein n=1 Tax=Nocardioides marmoriginsengisoli TaxID=661483 RepID=UPI0011CE7473|nr:hypothetical protein [Nocardioides marmoriginsengisoli]
MDAHDLDGFLEESRRGWDGTDLLPTGGLFTTQGALISVGGADVFAWRAMGTSVEVTELEIALDDDETTNWKSLGVVPTRKGILLVGGPEALVHYVPCPPNRPVDVQSMWLALTVRPGLVELVLGTSRASEYPTSLKLVHRNVSY